MSDEPERIVEAKPWSFHTGDHPREDVSDQRFADAEEAAYAAAEWMIASAKHGWLPSVQLRFLDDE